LIDREVARRVYGAGFGVARNIKAERNICERGHLAERKEFLRLIKLCNLLIAT
jgi:hypothetical protein